MSISGAAPGCYCLLLALLLSACGGVLPTPSPQDLPFSAVETYSLADCSEELGLSLADTSATLRAYWEAQAAYLQSSFQESLTLAHHCLGLVTAEDPNPVNSTVRAATAQLLCVLHQDQSRYIDSILYYETMARKALPAKPSPYLAARHHLCRSFAELNTYSWRGIGAAANQGIKELNWSSDRFRSHLYGRLKLMKSWSNKKLGDKLKGDQSNAEETADADRLGAEKISVWTNALADLRASEAYLRRNNSDRWREARREMVLLYTRLKKQDSVTYTIDTLAASLKVNEKPHFGFPKRLRGYNFSKRGDFEKATLYYEAFLQEPPEYDYWLISEAYFELTVAALVRKDIEDATKWYTKDFAIQGCEEVPFTEENLLKRKVSIPKKTSCLYTLAGLLGLYVKKYTGDKQPDLEKLSIVNDYLQKILEKWEDSFLSLEGNKILAQINENGYRVLINSLESAIAMHRLKGGSLAKNELFQTMEKSKALLLRQQLADYKYRKDSLRLDSMRDIQVRIDLLSRRKVVSAASADKIDKEELRLKALFKDVTNRFKKNEENLADAFQTTPDNLQQIQSSLGVNNCIVEYSEGDSFYHGLYVAQDTVISFTTPTISSVNSTIDSFMRIAQTRKPSDEVIMQYDSIGGLLFNGLIAPFYECLPAKAEVLIIPSGKIQRLPFAAIPTEPIANVTAALPYFLYEAYTRYASSYFIADLLQKKRRPLTDQMKVIVQSNDELRKATPEPIGPSIKETFHNTLFNERRIRNIEVFEKAVSEAEIVHLFVHGSSQYGKAFDNDIQLSPKLSISGLELSQFELVADLVFLAACRTSYGAARLGEGTLSISRSFHLAGATDVIGARWDVPVYETSILAKEFYRQLHKHKYPTATLNEVQRSFAKGAFGDENTWIRSWAGMVVE